MSKKQGIEQTTKNIYLFGHIDFDSAKSVIQEIDSANKNEECEDILITICSGGGSLVSAFAICEHIRLSKKTVNCLATGWCASAAVAVLQAGKERTATKLTRFLLHPSIFNTEDVSFEELKRLASFADVQHDEFVKLIISKSGATKEEFEKHCVPVKYLLAEEASKFGKNGLIDKVI